MNNVTLCVTSCGRHDLLETTLRSFEKFNTHPIAETIICEDGDALAPAWLQDLSGLGRKTWIAHGKRKGQIYSADRAWAEVQTEYVFWCEDDWEFIREGFIEESLGILERYPNIVQCSIRDDWDHPSVTIPDFPFPVNQPDWREGWSGFSFNPGLRRLADYQRIGGYGKHVSYYPKFVGELELSKLYRGLGYYAAALPAACRHIGEGNRHVPWETAPKAPKVLIAIPACHEHNYETHADNSIHRNNASNERIEAVRATWQKYVAAFGKYVEMKFFYGQIPEGMPAREPEPDEVFLPVQDAYDSLPLKVQAIYKWALEQSFDFAYKADDDTFAYIDRLLASGFENYDYIGYCTSDSRQPLKDRYASGGSGYWVSQKAMKLLASTKVDDWAEDRWVGKVLFQHDIRAVRDPRYLPGFDRHFVDLNKLPERHSYISFHACSPEMMKELFERPVVPNFDIPTHAMNEGIHLVPHPGLTVEKKERVERMATSLEMASGIRVLIAITACHHRKHLREAQRATWLKDVSKFGATYRYFLGCVPPELTVDPRRGRPVEHDNLRAPIPERDEVFLDVPDTYDALPAKTGALIEWAYLRGYDFVFKCDDDTFVCVDRLLNSGYEAHDYTGFQRTSGYFGAPVLYAQGGAGYWLSRKAIERTVGRLPAEGPEDINVARILCEQGIQLVPDRRYGPNTTFAPAPGNEFITVHQCTPELMAEVHNRFQEESQRNLSAQIA